MSHVAAEHGASSQVLQNARRTDPHSGECGNVARARGGFTLIELLLTIAILAIIAAAIIPQLSSDLPERLDAAAQVVVADLEYARSLSGDEQLDLSRYV